MWRAPGDPARVPLVLFATVHQLDVVERLVDASTVLGFAIGPMLAGGSGERFSRSTHVERRIRGRVEEHETHSRTDVSAVRTASTATCAARRSGSRRPRPRSPGTRGGRLRARRRCAGTPYDSSPGASRSSSRVHRIDRVHHPPGREIAAGRRNGTTGGEAVRPLGRAIRRHASSIEGPPRRWIAPSTPPPPSNVAFAAFTMASTGLLRDAFSTRTMRAACVYRRSTTVCLAANLVRRIGCSKSNDWSRATSTGRPASCRSRAARG